MKILVLEDNERLANLIKTTLEKENFCVNIYSDGETVLEVVNNGYHCFILDINVPSLDGISVLETIRMYNKDVPVIIISSNHELDKIKEAYELGADDYLKKPFFNYELVQKVKKLCQNQKSKSIKFLGDFTFNYETSRLFADDNEEIKLSKKEILFLELFVKDRHKIVTFSELENYIWEGEGTSVLNIRALIKRLRKKLPQDSIETIKEIGYRLK